MIWILYILFAITLFQDVKYRGVHWSVFLALLVCTAIFRSGLNWNDLGLNLMFLTFLLSALTLYLSLKQGHIVDITRGFFSWGDILFLVAITPLFEWRMFMLIFTVGTFACVLVHMIIQLIKREDSIPYAGYMAGFIALFIAFEKYSEPFLIAFK